MKNKTEEQLEQGRIIKTKRKQDEDDRKKVNLSISEEKSKISTYYEDLIGITSMKKKDSKFKLKREYRFCFTYKMQDQHRWVFRGPELGDSLKKALVRQAKMPIDFRINKTRVRSK